MVTASLLCYLPRTEAWGKNVFNWIVPLGSEPSKGFRASAATCLWDTLPRRQPAFSPVPEHWAAAWMQFVIAHWLRHADKLIRGWKKDGKDGLTGSVYDPVAPCTDKRGSFCFANMICVCLSKMVYVLFVYSNLLLQGINCHLLWQGVFAWKPGVWRIVRVQLQKLLLRLWLLSPETLNGLQNVTEQHNFIGMVTAGLEEIWFIGWK